MSCLQVPCRRQACAFTLLELLVVVTVLGILVALALPALGKTLDKAQTTQSMGNLRQLVTANMAYAAENGFYCPADNKANTLRWCAKKVAGKWDPTQGYLSDYLGKSRRVTMCPVFKDMIKGNASFEDGTGGYGYNETYVGGRPELSGNAAYSADGSRISARMSAIWKSNTVMFASSAYATGSGVQEYPFCHPPFWTDSSGVTSVRSSPSVHFRFDDKALIGWCDGRVTAETCDPREVGFNPHGGNAEAERLGWFGPDESNGYWNPAR